MPKVKTLCKNCRREVEFWPSQQREFCSLQCRSRWMVDHGEKPMPTKPRRGVTEPCETCGAPVYKMKSSVHKRFCSIECHNESQRRGISRICDHCGATIVHPPSARPRFCDKACYEAHRVSRSSAGRRHNGRDVIKDWSGYLRIWEPDHPNAMQGRVLEHRWIMEQALGRILTTEEHVHHINGVKTDNRPENLTVLSADEHRRLTAAEIKQRRNDIASELEEYRRRFGPLT